MLSIKFNQQDLRIPQKQSLADFLSEHASEKTHFVVAINQNFVPRSRYAETTLQDGDLIETVAPMQGG